MATAEWDHITDFLVVGSGGGLAGAVTASVAGLDVLVVEKTERIGGSTCMSGGVLWLPNNPLMARDGVPDDRPIQRRSWYRHLTDWRLVAPTG